MDNGIEEYESVVFTKSERKAVRTAVGLFFALIAISLFLMIFNTDKTVRVGAGWLYGAFAAALTAIGATVAYVVLYAKVLCHIKVCKKHFTVLLVGILIITACISFFAVDRAADIFGGAREITTNKYKIYDNMELHFPDGEKSAYVFIPKDVGAEIAEVPLVSDRYGEAVSDNGFGIHTESIYIKYYPHTKTLLEVRKGE
ncbi:MAG: hypothetical protein K2J80_00850 [Oscillospiraceae bacterium]|nr:hypothetical protein [Oscillospiraceae bacterium]